MSHPATVSKMNPLEQIPIPDDTIDEIEIDMDATSSVDEFIKQLEAKEKDLHITSDMTFEISDSDSDDGGIPEFVAQDLSRSRDSSDGLVQNAQSSGLKTQVYELKNELNELKRRMTSLRAERNEVQEKSDRRLKDFENYKYRMDRERRGGFIDQISNLASQMLPVLDNLDRALDSMETSKTELNPEFRQFYDGIALVNQQVNEVFTEMGVQPIATVGETFDPNFHEAVATEERSDLPANTVSEEMLRGYRIGNRVIRHSMVKVILGSTAITTPDVLTVSNDDSELMNSPDISESAAPDPKA